MAIPTDIQLQTSVLAVQKFRKGEPIQPKSLTRAWFGPYLTLIRDWQDFVRQVTNGHDDLSLLASQLEAYWLVVRRRPEYALLVAAVDREDCATLAGDGCTDSADAPEPADYRPILTCLNDVQAKAIEWLWWPYIALGKVCMVDGDPGLGKSLLTLQLAARLSVGDPLPDQQGVPTVTYGGPQKTLILCQEDGLEDTIKPRLDAAGADCRQIIHMGGWLDKDGGEHYFDLQHLPALEEAVKAHRPALVLLDPIQSYFGKVNINQSNETRPLLDKLTALAVKYQCAMVLIRHPAKPGQSVGKVIHRGLGSVDLIGAARTGLFVEQHPADVGKVLLGQSKSNIGPLGRTQVFTKYHGEFLWCGVSRLTAEMIGGSGRGPDPSAFLEAVCWLEARLEVDVPEKSDVLEKEADAQGISHKVYIRARKALGISVFQTTDGWKCTLRKLRTLRTPSPTQPQQQKEEKEEKEEEITGSTGATGATGATGSTGYSDPKSSTYDPEDPLDPEDPEDPEYPVNPIVSGGVNGASWSTSRASYVADRLRQMMGLYETDDGYTCEGCGGHRVEQQPSGRLICLDCLGVSA